MDANNPSYSSLDGILFNKSQTLLIHCPRKKSGKVSIPEGVSSIWEKAFYGCAGLTGMTIPDTVTRIDANAFNGCSGLTSVTPERRFCY